MMPLKKVLWCCTDSSGAVIPKQNATKSQKSTTDKQQEFKEGGEKYKKELNGEDYILEMESLYDEGQQEEEEETTKYDARYSRIQFFS